jgi:hypothetical protein
MEAVFQARRDSAFRLLTSSEIDGVFTLDHYLTIVPVKIQGSSVEVCFVSRWNVNISRLKARATAVKPQPRPGEAGYRRFRNLKLTLGTDDPVRIRRYDPELPGREDFVPNSTDVVLRLLSMGHGRVEFSISGPSDQIIDLTPFESQDGLVQQGLDLREMLDRLNHGDVRDRRSVL